MFLEDSPPTLPLPQHFVLSSWAGQAVDAQYSGQLCSVYVFAEDKLYIIMELVEGAPLGEHFNSLKEKGTRFSEERIWHIFIQVYCWKFFIFCF